MSIADMITSIEENARPIFEEEQEQVMKKIVRAETVFFLDTCFITRACCLKKQDIQDGFETMAGGKEEKKLVLVVTELVLYELKDSQEDKLQEKPQKFFEELAGMGFCLVLLKEQCICECMRKYSSYETKQWNQYFAGLLSKNVAALSKLSSVVKNDEKMPYQGLLEWDFKVPGESEFIKNVIVHIKERKNAKDSLAEELMCICILFLMEVTRKLKEKRVIVCTNDMPAMSRMRKAVKASYPVSKISVGMMHTGALIHFLVQKGIMCQKAEIETALKTTMGERFTIMPQESYLVSAEIDVSAGDLAEKMLRQETFVFFCRKS